MKVFLNPYWLKFEPNFFHQKLSKVYRAPWLAFNWQPQAEGHLKRDLSLIKIGFLSGFVCAYHPAAPSSSPKHAIYAFSFIVFVLYLSCEKNENKQKKRPGLAHLKKKNSRRGQFCALINILKPNIFTSNKTTLRVYVYVSLLNYPKTSSRSWYFLSYKKTSDIPPSCKRALKHSFQYL